MRSPFELRIFIYKSYHFRLSIAFLEVRNTVFLFSKT